MARDPFDEFKKMEKMFRKVMKEGFPSQASASSISIKKVGDETEVHVSGDVSEEKIEELKRKYPDAEINVEGEVQNSSPVEVLDERDEEDRSKSGPVEEVEEEEMDPQELALKRYRENTEDEE